MFVLHVSCKDVRCQTHFHQWAFPLYFNILFIDNTPLTNDIANEAFTCVMQTFAFVWFFFFPQKRDSISFRNATHRCSWKTPYSTWRVRKLDRRGNSNQGGGRGLAKAQLDRFLSLFTGALSFVDVLFCVGCTFPSGEDRFGSVCAFTRPWWQPLFHQPALFLPVSEGGIPSTAQASAPIQYRTPVLTIKADFHPKPSQNSWLAMLLFPSCLFSFFFPFPFCCPRCCERRRKKCQALLVTVLPISVAKLADPRLILSDGLEN